METTRHFTSTVYIVNDGATALHEHERLGLTIPPGGHVERDELPHEAGLREVTEETGLEATLIGTTPDVPGPAGTPLPTPRYQVLYDIDVHENGGVSHQHIDHVFFAITSTRAITPAPTETPADAWEWYTPAQLRASDADPDTVHIAIEAIEAAA